MVSWNDYVDYLKELMIEDSQVQAFSETKFILTDFGKSKYPTANQQELEEALSELCLSQETSFELYGVHHKLPDIEHQIEEEEEEEEEEELSDDIKEWKRQKRLLTHTQKTLKNWDEMYANNAVFGKKQNQPYSQEIQRLLKNIYQDWREKSILEIKITESQTRFKAKFDEEVEKFFYSKFKEEGEKILKEGIKDHEKLAKITNEDLNQNKDYQKLVGELKKYQSINQTNFITWIKNLTWKNYLFGGLGIFLIFGFLLIIWKGIFKKYIN